MYVKSWAEAKLLMTGIQTTLTPTRNSTLTLITVRSVVFGVLNFQLNWATTSPWRRKRVQLEAFCKRITRVPANDEQLHVGSVFADARPNVHGEDGGTRIENGRERTHEGG